MRTAAGASTGKDLVDVVAIDISQGNAHTTGEELIHHLAIAVSHAAVCHELAINIQGRIIPDLHMGAAAGAGTRDDLALAIG